MLFPFAMHWPRSTQDLLQNEPSIETVVFRRLLDTHWDSFWSSATLEETEVGDDINDLLTDAEWEAAMIVVEAHVTNAALLVVSQCGCWDEGASAVVRVARRVVQAVSLPCVEAVVSAICHEDSRPDKAGLAAVMNAVRPLLPPQRSQVSTVITSSHVTTASASVGPSSACAAVVSVVTSAIAGARSVSSVSAVNPLHLRSDESCSSALPVVSVSSGPTQAIGEVIAVAVAASSSVVPVSPSVTCVHRSCTSPSLFAVNPFSLRGDGVCVFGESVATAVAATTVAMARGSARSGETDDSVGGTGAAALTANAMARMAVAWTTIATAVPAAATAAIIVRCASTTVPGTVAALQRRRRWRPGHGRRRKRALTVVSGTLIGGRAEAP